MAEPEDKIVSIFEHRSTRENTNALSRQFFSQSCEKSPTGTHEHGGAGDIDGSPAIGCRYCDEYFFADEYPRSNL